MAKFRATDKITKYPHRSCVILWGLVFLLFLIIDGDGGEVSQLTLRMTSNSLSLFEVIGRRIYPHKDLWERVQMLTH